MKDFSQLKKNLKKDFTGLKRLKLAVLGDSATQFLTQSIRAWGYESGFDFEIYEADFNQVDRQILDPNSTLYAFEPELVVIFQSAHKLLTKYNQLPVAQQADLADAELQKIARYQALLQEKLKAQVLYFDYAEINDSVFGSFALKTPQSFLFQLRTLNYQLMRFASETANFYLIDLSSIQNQMGAHRFFSPSIYIHSDLVLSLEAVVWAAARCVEVVKALQGKFKKCLILDLDNTTWGGIIGDDGLERIQIGSLGIGKAFTEFQQWVKKLQNRGIILAVCSKNTDSIAREPFEKHPDMVLKLDDIAVFVANWDNKVDNIRKIQSILNIGFDSMVFLDDNPFERNLVREHIPDITVPELPEDPADYLSFLYTQNLFETVSFSALDTQRTQLYQKEAQRQAAFEKFDSEEAFLASLQMVSEVKSLDSFNIPRVAELSQRSNQFNLRTIRYTISEVEAMAQNPNYQVFTFTLEDKFGQHGLISLVVLQKSDERLFIENWLMSCRVLKRGMEAFVLNQLVQWARENGFSALVGAYIPTSKNELVKNHYRDLGFVSENEFWLLDLAAYEPKTTYIAPKSK